MARKKKIIKYNGVDLWNLLKGFALDDSALAQRLFNWFMSLCRKLIYDLILINLFILIVSGQFIDKDDFTLKCSIHKDIDHCI